MQRKLSHLHFVGIGGIGMAALAELLHAQGFEVSGTDLVAGATVERLRAAGNANVKHTEFPGASHSEGNAAVFSSVELVEWMLGFSRGQ